MKTGATGNVVELTVGKPPERELETEAESKTSAPVFYPDNL